MTPESWVALTLALVLGAMSPGPSLALVLRNTMRGGRRHGMFTGLGHGIGFGLFAFMVAVGMEVVLAAHHSIEWLLRWGGAALLLLLGYTLVRRAVSGMNDGGHFDSEDPSGRAPFVQGFLIALFNPKVLAWMLAIFAPFIRPGAPLRTSIAMGILGMCTDAAWYVTVATVLSGTGVIRGLRSRANLVDGSMGVFMVFLAAMLAAGVF